MENQIDNTNDPVITEKKKRCPMRFGVLITLIALIIFLVSYSLGMYRLIAVSKQLAQSTVDLKAQSAQNQQDLAALKNSLSTTQDNLQGMQTDLASQQEAVTELQNIQQTTNDEWTVAEARYLVKLANDNLMVGDNIPLIINLLQTADQELKGSSNPQFESLRKALADDLANLKTIPTIDFTGIYMRLSALNDQVDRLPLLAKAPVNVTAPTSSPQTAWWKRGWQNTLEALRKIVVVRYNASGVRPFILPDQQEFLYQNIHAMYAQAMFALVHRQPEIYQASLLQAAQWIQKYFLADSPVTEQQLKALTELQAINIRPSLPATLSAMQAFHDFTAEADNTNPSSKTTTKQ